MIIRFACIVLINFLTLHSIAQVKLSTFTLNGEEYEVMPSDEGGRNTWRDAMQKISNKQAYGYSDWFLPNIDQLRAMYAHQNSIGGFTDNWYWSSTQDNRYSSVVIDFHDGQSFPADNRNSQIRCRYIRKTGRIKQSQEDFQWLYGEWIGKYQYYHHVWKEAYMVVTITPDQVTITDKGNQLYKGKYVIKDNLIEYIPYHNDYGWIGSDEYGFLEILPEKHQLGSGYKKLLDKAKSYNYSTRPQQISQQNSDNKVQVSTLKTNEDKHAEIEAREIFDEQEVFQIVEKMPAFPGGEQELMEYIANNVVYPEKAREEGIRGRVFVGFVVEPDGSISNVKMLRSIGGGCDEEAMRVVKSMPKWKPGIQDGKAVRVFYQIPIFFK